LYVADACGLWKSATYMPWAHVAIKHPGGLRTYPPVKLSELELLYWEVRLERLKYFYDRELVPAWRRTMPDIDAKLWAWPEPTEQGTPVKTTNSVNQPIYSPIKVDFTPSLKAGKPVVAFKRPAAGTGRILQDQPAVQKSVVQWPAAVKSCSVDNKSLRVSPFDEQTVAVLPTRVGQPVVAKAGAQTGRHACVVSITGAQCTVKWDDQREGEPATSKISTAHLQAAREAGTSTVPEVSL
jgi:hypothetical protein